MKRVVRKRAWKETQKEGKGSDERKMRETEENEIAKEGKEGLLERKQNGIMETKKKRRQERRGR